MNWHYPSAYQSGFRSGRGGEIEISYIHCINGREPEAFEIWAFSEDGICEVHLFASVQISDKFIKETLYSHFFNVCKYKFLFWVTDPWTEMSNGLIFPERLRKLEVVSQLGLKIPLFTPGVSILMLFRRMFLISYNVQYMMFLLPPHSCILIQSQTP